MAELQNHNVVLKVISFLSSQLQRLVKFNDMNSRYKLQKISVFNGLTIPIISIQSYLERIFKYANCSPDCFVVASIYLDRFAMSQPFLPINSFNVHRLLISSIIVAEKFIDHRIYNNAHYAKVGGISTKEMNCLELEFLFGLSFDLYVTSTTFDTYCLNLYREMSLIEPHLHLERSLSLTEEEESMHRQLELAVQSLLQF